jgi:hypothetical protein
MKKNKYEIGDIVIINELPYEGCFEAEIGFITQVFVGFCYVTLFKINENFTFRMTDIELYYD